MRLADLPITLVRDGRRVRLPGRKRGAPVQSHEDAYRDMLAQAQDTYRQALGCIVLMLNAPGLPLDALRTMRETGRDFLRAAGACNWTMPAGVRPANQRRRTWPSSKRSRT